MVQEDRYQIKFSKIQPWINEFFQLIKKEIKGEYLRQHPQFVYKYFQKKGTNKWTIEEISSACQREISEGNEEFAEWAVTRWVMKNAELYQYFATELCEIDPEFDQIETIPADVAEKLLTFSLSQFGPKRTYIFSVLNSVSFTPETYEKLRAAAEAEKEPAPVQMHVEESIESAQVRFETTIQKLTEKYEKRLQGLERKYCIDMDGMKKQIAQLHKKLGAVTDVR